MSRFVPARRARRFAAALVLAFASLAACAGGGARSLLSPMAPERARSELAAAQVAAAARPGHETAQLRLGEAQFHAGDDDAAVATLAPLVEREGAVGARAALHYAAASERRGDLAGARRGYARFLAHRRSAEVERRLHDVTQREADAAVRDAIAREQSLDATTYPERSITILPLRVAGADSALAPLGFGLADLIATDLARGGKLEVVERAHVSALLREMGLGSTGVADSASAPRAGRLLGARRVVDGTLTLLPRERLRIDASVSDVPTAEVLATPAAAGALDAIFEAQSALVFRIFTALGITLSPAERRAIAQRPTRDLAAFLAYSRGVRDEAHGRHDDAAARYAEAVRMDPGFQLARQRMQQLPQEGAAEQSASPAASAAVVARVNPSPAARLSIMRERQEELRSLLEGSESVLIVIPIVFIPIP